MRIRSPRTVQQTAVIHFEYFFFSSDHEVIINADFTKFVFDHRNPFAMILERILLSKVVLPDPKKPVSTVTGIVFSAIHYLSFRLLTCLSRLKAQPL